MTKHHLFETMIDEAHFKARVVTLQPVAMIIPNEHCVYSPSKLEQKKEVIYDEFLARFANHSREIRICFDETPSSTTIFQRSELIKAYSFGLDCWYIVTANGACNTRSEQ